MPTEKALKDFSAFGDVWVSFSPLCCISGPTSNASPGMWNAVSWLIAHSQHVQMICRNFLKGTCTHKSWDDSYSCWFVGACLCEFIVYRKPNVHPTRNYWKKMLVWFNRNEESSFSSTFEDFLKKKGGGGAGAVEKILNTVFLFFSLCTWSTQTAASMWLDVCHFWLLL